MTVEKRRSLINFGVLGDKMDLSDRNTEKLIAETNPSALADTYRKLKNKNKAIQALQRKLSTVDKKIYSYEILSTYIYFEDYEGAVERAAALGFIDEPVERLLLFIFIHQHAHGKDIRCNSKVASDVIECTTEYLGRYFNINLFDHFRTLLEGFCANNPECTDRGCGLSVIDSFKEKCKDDVYLNSLSLSSLKYIYDELGVTEALRLLVTKDPKIDELYLRRFGKECSPSSAELVSILERVYSPSLFKLARKMECLNDCIIELKNYYEREPPNEIVFDSKYCRRIKRLYENRLKIRDPDR